MPWFIFPGQGSQKPGMAHDLYTESPAAKALLEEAAALAGGGWLTQLFESSAEDLQHTRLAQPALLAADLAAWAVMQERGMRAAGVAGHSLGEFAALVAAGSLDFEEAFKAVIERARLMDEMAPAGGMMAVLGIDAAAIEAALPPGAYIANYNGPSQTLVAGAPAALDAAASALKAAGARRFLPIAVSGPFHSPHMHDAAAAFADVIGKLALKPPEIPFVSSVSGQVESSPERIQELLAEQIIAPVQWTAAMETIGDAEAYECGPGSVLTGLAKRMPNGPRMRPAGSLEAIAALP